MVSGSYKESLEARVGIEPTHKGFADPPKPELSTVFAVQFNEVGGNLSEFCPTWAPSSGARDRDCGSRLLIGDNPPVRQKCRSHQSPTQQPYTGWSWQIHSYCPDFPVPMQVRAPRLLPYRQPPNGTSPSWRLHAHVVSVDVAE